MKTADKLCKGLGVSISALVCGVEEKEETTNVSLEDLLSGVFEIVVPKHIQK